MYVGELGTLSEDEFEGKIEVYPQSVVALHILEEVNLEMLLFDVHGAGFHACWWLNDLILSISRVH